MPRDKSRVGVSVSERRRPDASMCQSVTDIPDIPVLALSLSFPIAPLGTDVPLCTPDRAHTHTHTRT